MMRMLSFRTAVALAGVVAFTLSCSLIERAVPSAGGSPEAATQVVIDGADGSLEPLTDPRIEAVLSLRSVQMELVSILPGASPDRTRIDIDGAGNQRLESRTPEPEGSPVTPSSPDWNTLEVFVVDGEAFTRMGKGGRAEADPTRADALRDLLYSPEGPGMWLILLPEGAFASQGDESKGGFQAERFQVDGRLEIGSVRGEIWVDRVSGALVAADLKLSESLLRSVDSGTAGEVTIAMTAEGAEVSPITVP